MIKKILFLDIDDTLLVSDEIFIYMIDKNGLKKKLTTYQYSKLSLKEMKNKKFDYTEFDNPYKIKQSIINGKPLYNNLKIVDKYIEDNWELGILTARGEESTVKENINNWLSNKLKNKYELRKENIYAVGDIKLKYNGKNSTERKINILKMYLKKYNNVCLMDDNDKTIKLIKEMNKNNNCNIEYIHV